MFALLIITLILLCHFQLLFLVQSPIDFYFLGAVYLCALTYIRLQVLELKERPRSLITREWIGETFCFTLALILGLTFYDKRSVWLDEYTQAQYAGEFWKCLACGAALEQQPPLSYALSALSLEFLEDSVFALRLPSLIAFAASVATFWRLLGHSLSSKYLRILGVILYVFNALIFYYMTEARPYALFLCLGLMFIESTYCYLKTDSERQAYQMAALAGLVLMSIGLQAEVLVAAPLLLVILLGQRHRIRAIVLMQVFSGLLFFPLLILISIKSYELQQFLSSYPGGYFSRLFIIAKDYFLGVIYQYRHFWPDLLVAGVGFLFAIVKKESRARFWGAFLLSFSLIFVFTFATFINWNLLQKYFIIVFPILIVCLLIGFEQFLELIQINFKGRVLQSFKFVFALLFIYKTLSYLLFFESRARPFTDNANIRWKELYKEIAEELDGDELIYTLGLNQLGEWGLAKPIGVEFYLGSRSELFASRSEWRSVLSFEANSLRSGSVFLIMPRAWSSDTLHATSQVFAKDDVHLRNFGGERVVELTENGATRNERLVNFFENLANLYGNQPWTLNVWATLAKLYQAQDRTDDQLYALKRIVALPKPIGASMTGSSLDYHQLLSGFLFEVSPSFVPQFIEKAKEDEKKNH